MDSKILLREFYNNVTSDMRYFLDFSKKLEVQKPHLNSQQRQDEIDTIMMEKGN